MRRDWSSFGWTHSLTVTKRNIKLSAEKGEIVDHFWAENVTTVDTLSDNTYIRCLFESNAVYLYLDNNFQIHRQHSLDELRNTCSLKRRGLSKRDSPGGDWKKPNREFVSRTNPRTIKIGEFLPDWGGSKNKNKWAWARWWRIILQQFWNTNFFQKDYLFLINVLISYIWLNIHILIGNSATESENEGGRGEFGYCKILQIKGQQQQWNINWKHSFPRRHVELNRHYQSVCRCLFESF